MKKQFLLLAFILSSIISNAQIFGYGFLKVPEGEIQNYIQNGRRIFQ